MKLLRVVGYYVVREVIGGILFGIIFAIVTFLNSQSPIGQSLLGGLLFGLIYGALVGLITSILTGLVVGLLNGVVPYDIVLIGVAAIMQPLVVFGGVSAIFQGSPFDAFFIMPILALMVLYGGTTAMYLEEQKQQKSI